MNQRPDGEFRIVVASVNPARKVDCSEGNTKQSGKLDGGFKRGTLAIFFHYPGPETSFWWLRKLLNGVMIVANHFPDRA